MKVLSLFDGIGCGMVALKRAGIKVDKYYASEIEKNAKSISLANNHNIIPLGDVRNISYKDGCLVEGKIRDKVKIDLLIGGSPCQGFSIAGKKLNFKDKRSILFFEFVRILNEVKPKYFLLENVKMKKEYQDIISKYLGVEPIEINSNLVSAQNRKRLYWTNIPINSLPKDKNITVKDISHEYNNDNVDLTPYKVHMNNTFNIIKRGVNRGKLGYFRVDSQANRVYSIHTKGVTLCGEAGGGAAKMGQYLFGEISKDGDVNGYIRKLTPIEAERLQNLPDNYTQDCDNSISDNQRYKLLGNAWTVDIIAHIFSELKKIEE